MTRLEEILGNIAPTLNTSWGRWKEILLSDGLKIVDDDSKILDETIVPGKMIPEIVERCTIKLVAVEGDSEVENWKKAYDDLQKNPPAKDDVLTTSDGTPVKLVVSCERGHDPFISARIFVPDKIGEKLGWFARGINDRNYGMRVIMLPRCRKEVIRRYGMMSKEVGVKSIRIIQLSPSGESYLGEVADW